MAFPPTLHPVPAADVLEHLPVPVAVRDADGAPVYRNAAHRRLGTGAFAGDAPDLEGLGIARITDPASGRIYLCSRMPFGKGPDVLEVLEDITGRESDRDEIDRQHAALARHADALARANRDLGVLDRAKAEFIALAAHEVRTPLTALANALALLRRGAGDGERFLAMAERGVARLSALADDLLAYTKLDVGHLGHAVAPVDLGALVTEAVDALPDTPGVRVRWRPPRRLPALHGDRAHLAQVVRVLLDHAAARAPEGGTVRVDLGPRPAWEDGPGVPDTPGTPAPPASWLELTVSDPGADACPDSGPNGAAGLGLGLAVGGRIAQLHGGALWASGGPDGPRLVLRLPCLKAPDARLLPVQEAWRRLRQHQREALLLAVRADPDALDRSHAACADACAPDGCCVAVPETGEVVGVGTGADLLARVRRGLRDALGEGPDSSPAGESPIRLGWCDAPAGSGFGAALARARAAVRPLSGPDGPGQDEGEGP